MTDIRERHNKILTSSSQTDEHYTPDNIIAIARQIMRVDRFDLDVATPEHNPTEAIRFYTKEDNALQQDWTCESLWGNPPFSQNLDFAKKLVSELPNINKAVWLSKTDTRPKWSRVLLTHNIGVICIRDYVRFKGAKASAPFAIWLHLFGDIDKSHVISLCEDSDIFIPYFK